MEIKFRELFSHASQTLNNVRLLRTRQNHVASDQKRKVLLLTSSVLVAFQAKLEQLRSFSQQLQFARLGHFREVTKRHKTAELRRDLPAFVRFSDHYFELALSLIAGPRGSKTCWSCLYRTTTTLQPF